MTHFVVQFHNLAGGKEVEYDRHLQGLPGELGRGLIRLQRYRLSNTQFPASTSAAQLYRGVTLFEIDDALLSDRRAILAAQLRVPRETGLLEADRTHLFHIVRHQTSNVSRELAGDAEHLMILMANYMPGMRDEWGAWYDEVHGPEGLGVPGVKACTRGLLADAQLDSEAEQPAAGVVIYRFGTGDFPGVVREFVARATGSSSTGIKWASRSPAVGPNRTTHAFDAVGPRLGNG